MECTITGLHLKAERDGDRIKGETLVEGDKTDVVRWFADADADGIAGLLGAARMSPVSLRVYVSQGKYANLSIRAIRCLPADAQKSVRSA